MTIRCLLLLKRKPGMTPEAFRQEYETGHSRLGLKLFGHLWLEYRRNYIGPATNFVAAEASGTPTFATDAAARPFYDVVTELIIKDEAALAEINRIAAANSKILAEDEVRLFDRPNCWVTLCDTVEENLHPTTLAL